MITIFEAFSGIGSQTMALKRLKIPHRVVGISEIDKHVIKSYKALHGNVDNFGDISKINTDDLPDFDLFTYSFPCQDISIAGAEKGFDKGSKTRSSLLWECQKIIENKKPKFLLMENVKAITFTKNRNNLQLFLKWLNDLGYKNYYTVLNAKNFNIPQNRERFFCISIRKDVKLNFKFPKKQRLINTLENIIDTKNIDRSNLGNFKNYRSLLNKNNLKNIDIDLFSNLTGINKIIILGNLNTIFNLKLYIESQKIFSIKGLCPTITTNSNILNFYEIKGPLFINEIWLLMGFTKEEFDKVKKVNSKNQLRKQAGNSIVVNVLEGIFKSLFIDSGYVKRGN